MNFSIEQVSDPKLKKLIELKVALNHPYIGVFVRKDHESITNVAELKDLSECYKIGSFVKITEITQANGRLQFVGVAHRRIEIEKEIQFDENLNFKGKVMAKNINEMKQILEEPRDVVLMVQTKNYDEELPDIQSPEYKAISMEIVKTIRDIVMENTLIRENLHQILGSNLRINDSPSYLADLASSITSSRPAELQAVLQEKNVMNRMKMALELLKKEKEILNLQAKIGGEVEEKIRKQHRQYMLHEQMKAVKKELGIEKDDREALSEKFKANLEGKTVPAIISETFESELTKLSYLEKHSTEFS